MRDPFRSPVPSRMKQAMRLLDRWYLAASADGTLWIQPRRSPMPFVECCVLVRRLEEIIASKPLRMVVLDLGDAQISQDRWPVLLGMLGAVAEHMKARIRVASYDPLDSEPGALRKLSSNSAALGPRATSAAQMKSACIVLEVTAKLGSQRMPA